MIGQCMTPWAGQGGGREDRGDWARSPWRQAGIGCALGQRGLGRGGGRDANRKSSGEAAAAAESVVPEAKATAPGGGGSPESRMRVRVGLTLLLCAVLLGTASASSGQYLPPGSEARSHRPPGLHPGQGLGGWSWRLHCLWSHLAATCQPLSFRGLQWA